MKIQGISSGYGDLQVIHDVSLHVDDGEIVALLGVNGAGKSTLLRAVSGLLPAKGSVSVGDDDLARYEPHHRVASGLVHVPEGRQLFGGLTVEENLLIGSTNREARPKRAERMAQVMDLFPILADRRNQKASTMSGGEQQMLAIGRGLMSGPRVLMLDEPSLGVAPVVIDVVMAALRSLADDGLAVLLVEQNAVQALRIADRTYVLDGGRIVASGPAEDFLEEDRLAQVYLGLDIDSDQLVGKESHDQ
jgi:branched-chain amino acid transport system ATP-binding protein